MALNKRIVYSIFLILALLFSAPHSVEGQIVKKILTTQKNKVLRDGSQYKGDMMLMQPHGRGKRTYADGSVYQGQFEYGRRHGEGTMIYANGEKYEGTWHKDMRNGRGTY